MSDEEVPLVEPSVGATQPPAPEIASVAPVEIAADPPTEVEATANVEEIRGRLREVLLASDAFPRGIRESLAGALSQAMQVSASGQPSVAVRDAVSAFAAALPANWRTEPSPPQPKEHPAGESFFTGDGALTTQQASQIARDQLKRHGFLGSSG